MRLFKRNVNFMCITSSIIVISLCVIFFVGLHVSELPIQNFRSNINQKRLILNLTNLEKLVDKNARLVKSLTNSFKKVINNRLNGDTYNVPILPVLVIACNRKDAISKSLKALLKFKPNIPIDGVDCFPIIVSQDCDDEETKETILQYSSNITFIEHPNQQEIFLPKHLKKFKGYYKIARHYRWALDQIFFNFNYDYVIVVEDDLEISVDFYQYFLGAYRLLEKDKTIWCISAWNDNGKSYLINSNDAPRLYRTDFFPGLGWMITKDIWKELAPKWPKAYWDDWVRSAEQRKNRSCIRPEISRTKTFGKFGVSNGQYYEKHLKLIILNNKFVDFSALDLSYLEKENYDKLFLESVNNAYPVSLDDVLTRSFPAEKCELQMNYVNSSDFKLIARKFGLMYDYRGGVPRTSYMGIVTFYYNKRRIYIRPAFEWLGYNTSWN